MSPHPSSISRKILENISVFTTKTRKIRQKDNASSVKVNRRASIDMVSQEVANNVIRTVVPVADSEKNESLNFFLNNEFTKEDE